MDNDGILNDQELNDFQVKMKSPSEGGYGWIWGWDKRVAYGGGIWGWYVRVDLGYGVG